MQCLKMIVSVDASISFMIIKESNKIHFIIANYLQEITLLLK